MRGSVLFGAVSAFLFSCDVATARTFNLMEATIDGIHTAMRQVR